MDGEMPKTPGYLLVTGFYMSKVSEKGVTCIHANSFPKVKILVSQKFLLISSKIFFHYFHDMQNFIRFQEFDFLNLTLT